MIYKGLVFGNYGVTFTFNEPIKMSSETDIIQPAFEHIRLDEESDGSIADIEDDQIEEIKIKKRKMKKKKKIFFRSDFTGEQESSSDEDENDEKNKNTGICSMDPHDLTWTMWFWYYIVFVSNRTFNAAEFCGEKLADFFGITTPKYQYVIDEYHRLKEEEEEELEAERCAEEYIRKQQAKAIQNLEDGEDVTPTKVESGTTVEA